MSRNINGIIRRTIRRRLRKRRISNNKTNKNNKKTDKMNHAKKKTRKNTSGNGTHNCKIIDKHANPMRIRKIAVTIPMRMGRGGSRRTTIIRRNLLKITIRRRKQITIRST